MYDDLKKTDRQCGFKVVALPIKRWEPSKPTNDNQIGTASVEPNQQRLGMLMK